MVSRQVGEKRTCPGAINNCDFYQTEQVVYIVTDGIDDTSGTDNDIVLKTPN